VLPEVYVSKGCFPDTSFLAMDLSLRNRRRKHLPILYFFKKKKTRVIYLQRKRGKQEINQLSSSSSYF
jgi:hypothetical protein